MTKGYIAADVAIKTAYFSFVAAALDVVVGRYSPLRLFGQGRCCIFRTGSKQRGTDSDLLFVTEVFVLSDVKPVRVCEPWCSADCALPRSGNRQAPHK
jgi:hypothetical protein